MCRRMQEVCLLWPALAVCQAGARCLPPAAGTGSIVLLQLSTLSCSYVRESKAVYKIAGFWQAEHKRAAAKAAGPASAADGSITGAAAGGAAAEVGGTGPLHALVSFLQALTSVDADGRIVVQPQQQVPPPPQQQQQRAGASSAGYGGSAPGRSGGGGDGGGLLKFVLLNAAAHFGAVVSAAHAVVLARWACVLACCPAQPMAASVLACACFTSSECTATPLVLPFLLVLLISQGMSANIDPLHPSLWLLPPLPAAAARCPRWKVCCTCSRACRRTACTDSRAGMWWRVSGEGLVVV